MAEKSSSKIPSTKKRVSKKDFLVVGLGASAGGVKSLQEFFATMPPDSGMAFVAILHLSPEHESNLPQILQAQTQMKVVQVNKSVKVEPNNVYVIPPNVQLEMVDGVIRPAKAERPHGHRVAIDVFFRTLAEAYEKNAVCIVLSGTGSDGTLGLKHVKESNGFAIVQDPEDAEYDSMPRAAINTQLADWVLPVHKMPDKLIHFRESSERLHLTNGADAEKVAEEINADESLREILTILRVRTGHDFSNYKTPTLVRRVARHIQIHELEDLPAYIEVLRQKPDEVQSLLKNLLINVTNFFRDKQAFESLQAEVVPKIFEGKTGKDTVRVWSCGCASGEEAYSLAMILDEYADTLVDPPKFQIFASDVDEEALGEAREHRYPEAIETDVSPERLKKFFVKEGSFYRVKKELRESVLFAPHNVLRDPPFSRLDLIVCRNLLIYLNRETQERVMQIFHFALNNSGFLFLGSSETADGVATLFTPVDKKQRVYSRRLAPLNQTGLPLMPVVGRWEVRPPGNKAKEKPDRTTVLSQIHYKLLENYAPSSVLVNQDFDIVYLSEAAGKFLRFASGEPSRNVLKAVNPALLPDLRAALFAAQRERQPSEFLNAHVSINGEPLTVNVIVRVVGDDSEAEDFFLVVFEERADLSTLLEYDEEKISHKDDAMEAVVRRLEEDLQRTKEHLRFTIEQHETAIEELKASNEELQAINEELRSASEELETSKEELQSVNEELTTVNHELKDKIEETSRVYSDLSNLMAATDIATIFLDKSLRIKRYTPPVEQLFNITYTDIGRPLEHFTHHLNFDKMADAAAKVLRTLKPFENETADKHGNSYLARFVPYRTVDDRIEGVVLNFIDITVRKHAEEAVRVSEERLQKAINIETVGVLFFNNDIEITGCNEAFVQMSGYTRRELQSNKFSWEKFTPDGFVEISNRAIEELSKSGIATPYEKEYIRKDGTRFWALFAAKRIGKNEIVEFVTDITEQKRAEAAIRESEAAQSFLVKLNDALRPLTDPNEIRSAAMRMMGLHLVVNRAAYVDAEREPDKMSIISDYTSGVQPWVGEISLSDFGAALGKDYAEGKTIAIADVQKDSRFADSRDTYAALEIGSAVGVPLLKNGRIVAAMGVHNKSPRNWTPEEISIIEEVAERTWAAIERARAEQALSKSEEKYRTLFDSIDEGVGTIELIFDEKMRVVDYIYLEQNPAFERQTGLSSDVIGKPISQVVPNLEAFWFETFGRVAKTGEPERFEHQVAALGKWFEVYVSRIGGTDSRKIVYVYNDITERKRAEAALAASEDHYRALINQNLAGIFEIDLSGEIIFANDEFCRMLGYEREELLKLPMKDFVHAEDLPDSVKKFGRMKRDKIPFEMEKRFVRKDGSITWVHNSVSPITNGDDKIHSAVIISLAITKRKIAEEALRKSEEQLQLIIESTRDYSIVTFDLEGNITRWNTGSEKMFGYTENEMIGKDGAILFTPEDRAAKIPEKEMQTALEKGRAEDERWHLRKDGTRFFASGVIQPLKDGELEGFVKIARDQTERLRAETALREQEMLRQFVRTQEDERRRIARDLHDHLGQQMTAMRLKLESLKKEVRNIPIYADLDEVQSIAEQMDRDVDFLAWELRPAALDDLGLRIMLANFVDQWSNYTGIKAEFQVVGLGKTRLDFEIETNLYRIAQESLNNIYKHAKAANVSVLLEKRGKIVSLIIEDDGIGFNVEGKSNRQRGLGLAGMRERAKICGGELEIESAKGKGTTIFVRVPVKQ